jgi:hypothetical protein
VGTVELVEAIGIYTFPFLLVTFAGLNWDEFRKPMELLIVPP